MKISTIFTIFILANVILSGCNMPLKPIPSATPPAINPAAISTTEKQSAAPTPKSTDNPTEISSPTVSPVPEIVHVMWPGSPQGKRNQTVHDQIDKTTAPQKQAFGGDDIRTGKYERPFDHDMNYLPFVDLVTVFLNREDPLWIYVTFKVNAPISTDTEGKTRFLVEVDTDLDLRGDVLIFTGIPKTKEWSTESVEIYTNPDVNVGGTTPVLPDQPLSTGRGYYQQIFNDGKGDDPDLAMSRRSDDADSIQLAFKNTLTGGDKGKFIWLPWADYGMQNLSLYEYNDHFTYSQAGYPLKEDAQNYPIKALWGIDNTCRAASGFEPKGTILGLCPEAVSPEPEGPSGCHMVCTGGHFSLMLTCSCQ